MRHGGHVPRRDGVVFDQALKTASMHRRAARDAAEARRDARQADPSAGRRLRRGLHTAGADRSDRAPVGAVRSAVPDRAETLLRNAGDPSMVIGATLCWTPGARRHDDPHVHGIVPAGGLIRWARPGVAGRPGSPGVRVPSRCSGDASWRNCERQLHDNGKPTFFGEHAALATPSPSRRGAPLRKIEWVVYAKQPFADRSRCWPTCRATPAWPSPTAADRDGRDDRYLPTGKGTIEPGQTRHKATTLSRRGNHAPVPAACPVLASTGSGTTASSGHRPVATWNWRASRCTRSTASARSSVHHVDRADATFVCAHCGHAMVVLQVFMRDCSIRAPPRHDRAP